MAVPEELAPPGTGLLAEQLRLFGDYRGFFEKDRARECEALVQAAGPHTGARLLKGVPPYIKWPIWRASPRRDNEIVPGTFGALQGDNLTALPQVTTVEKHTFNLLTVPRVVAEVTYLAGELGTYDRRVLCSLCQHALDTGPVESGYEIRLRRLWDLLGIARHHRGSYALIPRCLWRLGRTVIMLSSRDGLAGTWGTQGFFLMSRVATKKTGREWVIEYDFPAPANKMVKDNALCTMDIHRLKTMRSPAAENLYCLLYDVAQWSSLREITYSLPELVLRLGITLHRIPSERQTYQDWSTAISQVREASRRVYSVAQCLSDYAIEGRGDRAYVKYYLTTGPNRKGHLPPA